MIRERVRELREFPDPSERRRLRQAAGVSTIDVGRAIGVAPQTIGMWSAASEGRVLGTWRHIWRSCECSAWKSRGSDRRRCPLATVR